MDQSIIGKVQAAGFDVYMHDGDTSDTYLYFTDGKNIGYLQVGRLEGISLTSVHIPNTSTGTGFGVGDNIELARLDKDTLSRAFITYPHWATDKASVKKWRNMEHFLSSSAWNKRFKLVPKL